jgi:hypothetical protein
MAKISNDQRGYLIAAKKEQESKIFGNSPGSLGLRVRDNLLFSGGSAPRPPAGG